LGALKSLGNEILWMFWQVLMEELDLSVPPIGKYAVGMVFLPTIEHRREESKKVFNKVLAPLYSHTFVMFLSSVLVDGREYLVSSRFIGLPNNFTEEMANEIQVAEELGHRVLGWRAVKTNNSGLGKGAIDTEPVVAQVIVTPSSRSTSDFEQQVCRGFSSVRAENPGLLMFFLTPNWPT